MIRRTDDFSVLPDSELKKIASVVEKSESKKLFDIFDNETDAEIAATELKIKGFQAKVEKTSGKYKVTTIKPETIPLSEAEKSGQFKKLAWGRYCFQRHSGVGDFFNYNFDDGSIWRLATDENGNPILVKEIDDENEEVVIRTKDNRNQQLKLAAKKKDIQYTSDITVKTIAKILYDTTLTDDFINDATPEVKQALYKMFNEKLDKIITSKLQEHNITDEKDIYEIKKLTTTALTMEINSRYNLSKFINSLAKERLEKIGRQKKYFE